MGRCGRGPHRGRGRGLALASALPAPRPDPRLDPELDAEAPVIAPAGEVRFAHASERQFAQLLDFYGIDWQYEPREFILQWNRQGLPVQAFRPDFYLPAYDLYIEITTLNQKLVTKKNRKIRRLRELHPEVKVKILYQRDYLNLLMKFRLSDATEGGPDR